MAATVHDGQGLNVMVYNRCIGTRARTTSHKVRRFNFFNFTKDTPDIFARDEPDVTGRARRGEHLLRAANQREDRFGSQARDRDGDVKTACQQACPPRRSSSNIRDPRAAWQGEGG